MKQFDVITIFPKLFEPFTSEGLLARARKKKLLSITAHDLRRWTSDRHRTVDDRPYGGGAGMVLIVGPIYDAVQSISKSKVHKVRKVRNVKELGTRIILLSAKGKLFTQAHAQRLAKYDRLIFICGRYEGVDERVAKCLSDEELSIGEYVLFGGEVAAMVVIEATARLVPGVVAKAESVANESFSKPGVREHPHYTRPEVFSPPPQGTTHKLKAESWAVPKVLLSGNHERIQDWRDKHSKKKR